MSPHTDVIPEHCFVKIFQYVAPQPVYALVLVCRGWYRAGMPVLYSEISISPDRMGALRTLEEKGYGNL
jgi:hypothetical protein